MSAGAPRCLACGARDTTPWATARDVEYRTSDDAWTFHRCRACGVLFIDPVPADRLATIYPPTYYAYAPPSRSLVHAVKDRLDRRFFRGVLADVRGTALRALDVGGGAGVELAALRASDPRVTDTWVVDLDPGAAAVARANGHAYFCGRIEDFVPDRPFDVVLLLNLIEHVADPGAVLRKVAALLAPGGVVVVKTPNHDAWDARLFRHRSWAGLHCPRHWVVFTRESFARLAGDAGLEVRRATYTQGAPFWAASVLAWLAGRGLARITPERPVVRHPLFAPLAGAFAAFDFARRPLAKTSQMLFVLAKR